MKTLFDKRRQLFQTRLAKYLPYVFNDHFVLVLLVGLGAILYQYRELMTNFPTNPIWIYLSLLLLQVLFLGLGQVATYVQAPDRHYLLAKEGDLVALVKVAGLRASIFWSGLQGLLTLASFPLLLVAGWQVWHLFLVLAAVLLMRWLVMVRRGRALLLGSGLNWSLLVTKEQGRQQAILRFFALFTPVKGLTRSSHKRPYLNWLLRLIPKGQGKLYHNLYWRAFLRSGDHLGLFVRLTVLGALAVLALPHPYLGAVLAGLTSFLTVFQLLGLVSHYHDRPLLLTAPLGSFGKMAALLSLLRTLLAVQLLIQLALAKNWSAALLLLLINLTLALVYLPAKVKARIDGRGEKG